MLDMAPFTSFRVTVLIVQGDSVAETPSQPAT
jgi:hypothetical protein